LTLNGLPLSQGRQLECSSKERLVLVAARLALLPGEEQSPPEVANCDAVGKVALGRRNALLAAGQNLEGRLGLRLVLDSYRAQE
jgi:hypothetical protein